MNAFRYFYRCAGGQCVGLRMVSGEAVAARRSLLDERLDGDDNLISSRPSFALRLAHQPISAGDGDNGCVLGHDVEQHILGKSQRQVRPEAGESIRVLKNFLNTRL